MPLNAEYLLSIELPPIKTVITDRDAMFYALSIGMGRDPMDSQDLRYVYEKDLRIFPTMPLIIGHPGNWMVDPRTGITRSMVVHGAQRLTTHAELPLDTPLITTNRVDQLYDKGDKGAVMILVRETRVEGSGELVSRSESSVFCRVDGNFGGDTGAVAYAFVSPPERDPDHCVEMPTEPAMALFYRLNHDRNPLHADPEYARKAGFDRPIMHGLATYGLAAVAVTRAVPGRIIRSFEARFSKPVVPGETVTVDLWEDADGVSFRAKVAERNAVVLDLGRAVFQ